MDLTQSDLSGSLPIIRHNGLPDAGVLGLLAIVSPKTTGLGRQLNTVNLSGRKQNACLTSWMLVEKDCVGFMCPFTDMGLCYVAQAILPTCSLPAAASQVCGSQVLGFQACTTTSRWDKV